MEPECSSNSECESDGAIQKRFYIFNAGCIRRALDATRIHDYFIANGWKRTSRIGRADIVVVSTCGAVDKTEDLSLVALRAAAKRVAIGSKLIITGCLPKIDAEQIKAINELGDYQFVPTRRLDMLDAIIQPRIKFKDVSEANLVTKEAGLLDYVLAYRLFRHSLFLKLYRRMSTSRLFLRSAVVASEAVNGARKLLGMSARPKIVPYYNIRIAEGCAFNCSYCAIRLATGRVKSKPISEIVRELKAGVAAGHQLIQLVCEEVGSYGLDIKSNIAELLKALLVVEGDFQLILIDFGGFWLVKHFDELIPLFEKHADKVREIYVSLQSGSDRILRAMRRPEKTEAVVAKLKEMKQKLPHLVLRTTVIIGFPGETEEDFQQTVDAVRQIPFDAVELNKYEDRPGTAASQMRDKISHATIDRRHAEISQYV